MLLPVLLLLTGLVRESTPTGGLFQLRLHSVTLASPPPSLRVRVCVKHYQVVIDPHPPCFIGEATSREILNGPELGLEFDFEFKFRWPGTFSLIIEPSSPDTHRLLSRLSVQQWLETGPEFRRYNHTTSTPATFEYSYRVQCLAGYYGPACDTICRPRDDKFGHYSCGAEGRIVCMEGWWGEYCEKATCPACLHGACTTPANCTCHPGWTGPDCSQCLPHPGCKHGRCTRAPWECECAEGWGGLFCNQDLNYCTNHRPCRNGGTCFNTGAGSFTCLCPAGWGGADCGERSAGNGTAVGECAVRGCRNGGSCLGGTCICAAGWKGDECEEGFCTSEPCRNGGTCLPSLGRCVCPPSTIPPLCTTSLCSLSHCSAHSTCLESTGECQCHHGWTGPTCEERVNLCATSPCANGGRCVPLAGLGWRCECGEGWRGVDCSESCGDCSCKEGQPCPRPDCCPSNTTTLITIAMLQSELSTEHVALVIIVSVATPLLVLLAVGALVLVKRRRREELLRNEEVARRQNEENAIASGGSLGKGLDRWMVVNTWGEGGGGAKCSNLVRTTQQQQAPDPGGGRHKPGTRV